MQGKEFADVPVGLMLEVPAAAVAIDLMLDVVDFVSIGSNDLVQYLMAADRDNPKVSHLCQPLSPPVLRVLYGVIQACSQAGKPVTLCGEMAGQPRAFVILLGMGLRQFSMSPAFVPTTKRLAAKLTQKQAEEIFQQALRLKTTANVKRFMSDKMHEIAPDLEHISLIALEFPTFRDGRAYSTARLLRERHGYSGELRAFGNVLRDQLMFMHRCGFNAFEVAEANALDSWRKALGEMSVWYQPTADGRVPATARRQVLRAAE